MKRRHFVKLSGATADSMFAVPTALQSCMDNDHMNMQENPVNTLARPFTSPLVFPNVVTNNFSLTARGNTTKLLNNQTASVLGYSGSLLGLTLKVDSGLAMAIPFQNNLWEETNIHWYG